MRRPSSRAGIATPRLGRLGRYWLYQIPGILMVALGTLAAVLLGYLAPPWAVGATVAWIVKDAVLYPFVGSAYEPALGHAMDALVGRRGTAREALTPVGYVKVRGELWRARSQGAEAIDAGTAVEVVAVDAGVLVVCPVDGGPKPL